MQSQCRPPLSVLCENRWKSILASFGVPDKILKGNHGPCVFCGGKDRARFTNKNNKGYYYCNQCGAKDGFEFLMEYTGKNFHEVAKEIEILLSIGGAKMEENKNDSYDERKERLTKIYRSSHTICEKDTAAMKYLNSRGLLYSPRQRVSEALRKDRTAILTPIISPMNKVISYHAIFITKEGIKDTIEPVKKIFPPLEPLPGACCPLHPWAEEMVIGEGVESALAGHVDTGLPAIAAINAALLERLILPPVVRKVTILADNDENFTGQAAAYTLATRLVIREGRQVTVKVPDVVGWDWNDKILADNRLKK